MGYQPPPTDYREKCLPFPKFDPGFAVAIVYTGGLCVHRLSDSEWAIAPVRVDREICVSAPIPKENAQKIIGSGGFKPISINHINSHRVVLSVSSAPIVPSRTNHSFTPCLAWSNIARNISTKRPGYKEFFRGTPSSLEEIFEFIDRTSPEEIAIRQLSICISNMDRAIRRIAENYEKSLKRAMEKELPKKIGLDSDIEFSSDSQAFLAAFGAARDHFARLIAIRNNFPNKVDDLTKLLARMKSDGSVRDKLFDSMIDFKIVTQVNNDYKLDGWLNFASRMRKQYIHHAPFGTSAIERFGSIELIDESYGVWKFERPFLLQGEKYHDLLDSLLEIYKGASDFFLTSAENSGYDLSNQPINDENIISTDFSIEP